MLAVAVLAGLLAASFVDGKAGNRNEFIVSILAGNSHYRTTEAGTEGGVPVRTKRSVALLLDPSNAGSTRTDSAPIFAVLAEEPVFAEIARDAHARFLAHGRLENEADVHSLQQWLTRASS